MRLLHKTDFKQMQNKNLYTLSFLRIIFMFMIFLEHYPETFLRVGGKAVCFFFVLSGFVLPYGYGHKIDNGNITYRNFLTGRMVKLYPLHWLLLPIGYWITRNVFSETWIKSLHCQKGWKHTMQSCPYSKSEWISDGDTSV